jgi:hypothetical protein
LEEKWSELEVSGAPLSDTKILTTVPAGNRSRACCRCARPRSLY